MANGHGTILKVSTLDIFQFLANGKTYKEISAESGINMHTIHSRIYRFGKSIGALNKTHAVAILVKEGRISINRTK